MRISVSNDTNRSAVMSNATEQVQVHNEECLLSDCRTLPRTKGIQVVYPPPRPPHRHNTLGAGGQTSMECDRQWICPSDEFHCPPLINRPVRGDKPEDETMCAVSLERVNVFLHDFKLVVRVGKVTATRSHHCKHRNGDALRSGTRRFNDECKSVFPTVDISECSGEQQQHLRA